MYPEQAQQPINIYRSVIERNPDEWITGTEPMTAEQKHHLKVLANQTGETFDETLSKVSAAGRIKTLQQRLI